MFLIYINDIVNSSNILSFVFFADDTTVYIQHDSIIDGAIQIVNSELAKVAEWFGSNKLTPKRGHGVHSRVLHWNARPRQRTCYRSVFEWVTILKPRIHERFFRPQESVFGLTSPITASLFAVLSASLLNQNVVW